jgi:hypothetical protein
MLAMSVNDVPGWFVTIPPSGIGVPVAFTPGLVPHCDVADAAALPALGVDAGLLDELLLHPAAATSPMAATSAAAPRAVLVPPPRFAPAPTLGACCLIFT